MPDFVDDRDRLDDLDVDLEDLEGFDKLGDPEWGAASPDRCHVCLAWTRHPYSDGALSICPGCRERGKAEREEIRHSARAALREVWAADDDPLAMKRLEGETDA